MCGIAGIFYQQPTEQRHLEDRGAAMAGALRHRGPDDHGIWVDTQAGLALAHARLSIIDLSEAGHQPMVSHDGRFVMAYNGEIYNHEELKKELLADGVSFRGHSDTEIALEYIARRGLKASLTAFNGMFAIALWSMDERCLYLIRDRVGIKPLYYGRANGAWLFASELKAVYAAPERPSAICPDALGSFMRHGYVPDDKCIFREMSKVRSGSIVRISLDALEPEVSEFWSLQNVIKARTDRFRHESDDACADALQSELRASVERRLVADVPVGAFLSGGIDSSLVVAMMREVSSDPVHTFTIGFDEARLDESGYAKAVSDRLGTVHHELQVLPEDALELIPSIPRVFDEPFADPSQLPTVLVSRLAAERVKVALSGDGGDELFCGYARYEKTDRIWRKIRRIPLTARRHLAKLIRALYGSGDVQHRLLRLAAMLDSETGSKAYLHSILLMDDAADLVLNDARAQGRFAEPESIDELDDLNELMTYTDFINYLPGDILTKVDRASMSVSLEARVPLLDHNVVETAWSIPTRIRGSVGDPKKLLKRVLYRYLDAELFERPKAGFGIPLATWLRGPLHNWAESLLTSPSPGTLALLDFEMLRRAWALFNAGRDNQTMVIWNALMFLVWYEEWCSESAA